MTASKVPSSRIQIEDIADLPLPGTVLPGAVRFSPRDETLTFLFSADGTLSRTLWSLDLESGARTEILTPPGGGATEANLSEEEKLRRERQRMRGLGITRYAWSEKGERILVPLSGDIHVKDGEKGELRKIADLEGPALDPRFSPDGERVAFVSDDELYVVPSDGSREPKQLTKGARGTGRSHGLAEYIAQEEMGRHQGYWWSKDSTKLAYTEIDETHIPQYRIVHQGKDAVGDSAQEDHAYPFAGAENARVRLFVVSSTGGSSRELELGDDPDIYLARVHWMPDGSLIAEVENRAQTELRLVRFDPKTGRAEDILTEKTEVWINLHGLFRALEEQPEGSPLEGAFVWGSERSGFMHLYLVGPDGSIIRSLTSGEWMVETVAGIDEEAAKLWFMGTKDGPLERHLYEVSLSGGDIRRITAAPGMHSATLDHDNTRFVDTLSTMQAPPRVTVRSLETGAELLELHDAATDEKVQRLALDPPRLIDLENRNGDRLYGAVYQPDVAEHGAGPYPTLVSVYGGPHAQRVSKSWGMTVDLRAQWLRDQGFLVFKLDNRGSARRGLAFEGAIKHDMGNLEVLDQVDGVQWLVSQGLCDPARVAMQGWSYGGYMSAMSLARAPETFSVAIAGAPVSHWDGYDTHYTERYMGTPKSNPEGYERSAVMHHVDKMTGKLMIVHGLIDENVHFRHSARLINALIAAGKDYELLLFPDERHGPRRPADRVYLERRMLEFLKHNLSPEP